MQGHKSLDLSEETKSQRVAPGCREDVGVDTKVMKSHRRTVSRSEAETFWVWSRIINIVLRVHS